MFLAHFFPLSERSGTCLSSILVFTCNLIALDPGVQLDYIFMLLLWLLCAAVNIKGVFNTSNETKYEKDPPDGTSLLMTVAWFLNVDVNILLLIHLYNISNAYNFLVSIGLLSIYVICFIIFRNFHRFQLLQNLLEFTGKLCNLEAIRS